MTNNRTGVHYTPIQLKLPVDLERKIKINDPVYSFAEVMAHIDLQKYFVNSKEYETARPRYDREKLLLPAYNMQLAIGDVFVTHYGAFAFASDMDCFQPLMEGFYKMTHALVEAFKDKP